MCPKFVAYLIAVASVISLNASDAVSNEYVTGQNSFGWSLLKALGEPKDNVCVSPYNISSAIQLAYMGAEGSTKQEIAKTLFLPNLGNKQLAEQVLQTENSLPDGVSNAKACAIDSSFLPTDQYLRTVTDTLDADVFEVDFRKQPNDALKSINKWVAEMTQDHIKELLNSHDINDATRLILLSAIYLKAAWTIPFSKKSTKDEVFHTLAKGTMTVPMMYQKELMRLYQDDDVQVLFRDFVQEDGDDNALEAVVILPRTIEKTHGVYNSLSNENLQKWQANTSGKLVEFSMPKCSLRQRLNLKKELSSMGMPMAFSSKADFTNISPELDVCIDDVIHEAYMQLDEDGIIAAGATAVKMVMKSMAPVIQPTIVMHCDRPYFVVVRDKNSGLVLFVSLISAPQKI